MRRDFDIGELRERRRLLLPILAGFGGMLVPIAVYLAFNAGRTAGTGWGVVMATDTALALGVLAVLGPRFSDRMRGFLLTVHPHAQLATEAAEAAAEQGAFWPMHDLLFAHQDALRPTDLLHYAGQLGLDVNRFREYLAERTAGARIAEDIDSAELSSVSGTPTFFINGRRHQRRLRHHRALRGGKSRVRPRQPRRPTALVPPGVRGITTIGLRTWRRASPTHPVMPATAVLAQRGSDVCPSALLIDHGARRGGVA